MLGPVRLNEPFKYGADKNVENLIISNILSNIIDQSIDKINLQSSKPQVYR